LSNGSMASALGSHVTVRNLSRALALAGARGLWLSFSAPHCSYCAVHEPEYTAYASLSSHSATLAGLVRVDASSEAALSRRYEVEELPALVLAWKARWTAYTGLHHRDAMVAFSKGHSSGKVERMRSMGELQALVEEQRRMVGGQALGRVLLLGFFSDFEEQEEELDDLEHASHALRQMRTDVPVRAAAALVSSSVVEEYGRIRRWFSRPPSVVMLLDGVHGGGEFLLDEQHDSNLDLATWAARSAVPELGELTGRNFMAYAATELPMLITFVNPKGDNTAVKGELRGVARRFRGKVTTVWCDGEQHSARMLALGLRPAVLPQVAINTKDGRQLPFDPSRPLTELSLSQFVADFLGQRLPPRIEDSRMGIENARRNGGRESTGLGGDRLVIECDGSNFERVAMDRKERCHLERTAERFAELQYFSVVVARFDVSRHKLPAAIRAIQLRSLPMIIALPAHSKEPPFPHFDGNARPKDLMYFMQRHASHQFELPPNPHLTREQHALWKEQVAELPAEKMHAAYEILQKETGLERDEL
ncbi:MAG: hypothetical protein SGPRY_003764, partial [Prymnesium sp.]